MMAWQMQIMTFVEGKRQFQSVRHTGGKVYEYPTADQAWHMLDICYPDQIREQRLFGEELVRVINTGGIT